ncbi:Bug family tripartite tricarboxylate transporter substrate binding protein [Bordetella hinzii]|uniref:Tripartite tricarboxylate transporter family receptor n=4 Tax=Bordetella hinzii TaxID=103855 RepID=A0ABR4R3G9_9BORD|nr:tripartite tricarboxylate transporter substrate binding protein [Bordetella hinzii]AKQ56910.1 Tripartite tricarboxylate transporter family receptor [Bordetella hinzii]KCB23940.1 tripartite tricarboxylate transporter family receptor [Bordetella hinzii OH87 BAL007II]KCB26321.1 tripartite tricarboxylate transporter family receptor [Bordetella hinzii L60]KCB27968.1 tripartite tricarboxylate transporter family receptor [Bordetella hinzii CA90 BAL1384]KCB43963.1 tripartite tricarboxylate transpor
MKQTLAALLLASALPAAQAAYPEQPIRIVIGYAAGGTTDILARALAEQLGKTLKQSIIVENKPGAAGNIAAASVQQAAPDGYTVFMATVSSHGINPALYKKSLGYDPVGGFAPVGMVASIPLVLVANPKLPATDVAGLVALAKSKPGEMNYSSSGNGSPVHLAGAMFAQQAHLDIVHVPYRGGSLANTAVMTGEAQFSFATLPGAMPQVKAGALRALAVTTRERSPQLPDVPTVAEAPGFKGYEINTWNALLAPKGTPPEAIATLNAALKQAMASDKLKEHFQREGATPVTSTPAELASFIQAELAKWAGVVQSVNIRVD